MSRLRADLCLLLVALIWGGALVAQKTAMDHLEPFGFVGMRFLVSLLVIIPLVVYEWRRSAPMVGDSWWKILPVATVFVGGVIFQQTGIINTSVTNAGFITGLYVLFTPFISWLLFRHMPDKLVWPACILSVGGLWYLNGGSFEALTRGDYMVLGGAVLFAAHVALTGWFLSQVKRPLLLVFAQYSLCAVVGITGAVTTETFDLVSVQNAWLPIFYGGVISGGIAYTLQAVAQQYTPPSDAAIIMSAEALFAAAAGVLILSEPFDGSKFMGCAMIFAAILCVEAKVFIRKKPASRSAPSRE